MPRAPPQSSLAEPATARFSAKIKTETRNSSATLRICVVKKLALTQQRHAALNRPLPLLSPVLPAYMQRSSSQLVRLQLLAAGLLL